MKTNRLLILLFSLSAVFTGISCSGGNGADSGTTSDDAGTVTTDTGEDSGTPGDTDSGSETNEGSESVTQGTADDTGTQSDDSGFDTETGDSNTDSVSETDSESGSSPDSGTGSDTAADSDSVEMFTFNIGFGGEQYENAFSVLQTPDGGYLVTGYTMSFVNDEVDIDDEDFIITNSDTLLGKFSPRGEIEWYKNYGDRFPQNAASMVVAPDGGYLLAGETMTSFGKTVVEGVEFDKIRENGSLLKVDGDGNEVWSDIYGETYTGEGFDKVIVTQDNHYLAVGYKVQYDENHEDDVMAPFPSIYDAQMMHYAVKTDLEGTVVWEKEFSAQGCTWNYLTDVVEGPTGYIVVGASRNFTSMRDFYVGELSKDSGEVNWDKLHPAAAKSDDDFANAIAPVRDQSAKITGYLVAGIKDRSVNYSKNTLSGDIRLLKIDTAGNKVDEWAFDVSGYENPEQKYVKAGIDEGLDIIPTPDGKFALLSVVAFDLFFKSYEECDVHLMKVDENGQVDWERRYGTAKRYDKPAEVAATADGGFVIVGSTQSFVESGEPLRDEWHIIKTDSEGEI